MRKIRDGNFFKEVNEVIEPLKYNILAQIVTYHRVENNEFVMLNPKRSDKNFGSFRFNLNSNKWADFATGDRGGDIISLYAYLNNLSQKEAAIDLLKMVGRWI